MLNQSLVTVTINADGDQRIYEAAHFSEAGVPDEIEAVNDRMQELFESESGTTLQDVTGYPKPSEDH